MKSSWLEIVTKNLTLLVFIAFLGVLYIANAQIAERKRLKIENLKKEVQVARFKYTDVKKSIQYTNLSTVVEKKVKDKGLKHPEKKPKVLKINKS